MNSIKLISLAILILSANVAIVNAQENETYDAKRLNEINRLYEMQKNYALPNAEKKGGMSKEQKEKILIKLPPEIKSKMEEIKKLDKVKYYQLLDSMTFGDPRDMFQYPSFSAYLSSTTKKILKKEQLLEIDIQLLTLKYKNADNASKSKIKSDLNATLSDLFDIREAKKQKEVKELETRLQELNKSLKTRKQNKDIIIERRIQELFGDSKYLEW